MNLKAAREKKERGLSVKEAIECAIEAEPETTEICIMSLDKEGNITATYSTNNFTGMLGIIEQSKHMMIDEECYTD